MYIYSGIVTIRFLYNAFHYYIPLFFVKPIKDDGACAFRIYISARINENEYNLNKVEWGGNKRILLLSYKENL